MRTDKKYTKLYVKFPKKLKISYTIKTAVRFD